MTDEAHEAAAVPKILDRSTLVPVGVALAVSAAFLTATLSMHGYLSAQFGEQIDATRSVDRRVERVEDELKRAGTDRWTSNDQRIWALELQQANPELKVPRPASGSHAVQAGGR